MNNAKRDILTRQKLYYMYFGRTGASLKAYRVCVLFLKQSFPFATRLYLFVVDDI